MYFKRERNRSAISQVIFQVFSWLWGGLEQGEDRFYQIQIYAFQIALTIIFLVWLVKAVWHEIRF